MKNTELKRKVLFGDYFEKTPEMLWDNEQDEMKGASEIR